MPASHFCMLLHISNGLFFASVNRPVVHFHFAEAIMKGTSFIAFSAIALGSMVAIGCESTNTAPAGQNPGYAGGNGSFGEDPVQPGEHSRQRFDDSTGSQDNSVPTTQPATGSH